MEWLKPIEDVEAEFRRHGSFLLVDTNGKLMYYASRAAKSAKLIESLKGRSAEMVNFLIARASVRVRPK